MEDKQNFIIINVTRDYFYILKQKDSDSGYFSPYEIYSYLILKKTHIEIIFKKLGEIILQNNPNKLIVVVFEEYFFSKGNCNDNG